MRRVLLPLACLLAVGVVVLAQAGLESFVEEGRATAELAAGGLQAAHPSLPIGSNPTIRNLATGRVTTVTVTGRISMSAERVVDLSPDAARAIGLEPGGNVRVYFPSTAVMTTPVPQPGASPGGVNITIHNYVIPLSQLPEWLARRPAAVPAPTRSAEDYFAMGVFHAELGNLDAAIRYFTGAIRLNPNAYSFFRRGRAYHGRYEFGRAIADYGQAIRLDPYLAAARYYRGVAYADIGNVEMAIQDFAGFILLTTDNPWDFCYLGHGYFARGEYVRAIAAYEAAFRLDPNHGCSPARNNLANARRIMGW